MPLLTFANKTSFPRGVTTTSNCDADKTMSHCRISMQSLNITETIFQKYHISFGNNTCIYVHMYYVHI